jgi:hypothetical protein
MVKSDFSIGWSKKKRNGECDEITIRCRSPYKLHQNRVTIAAGDGSLEVSWFF